MPISNKKKSNDRVVFRVDTNATIGLGHFSRCIAVAEMLSARFEICFALQSPSENIIEKCQQLGIQATALEETGDYQQDILNLCNILSPNDIVVLDGLAFDTNYQQKIKSIGCKLVCIDDLHAYPFVADAIINRDPSISRLDYLTKDYTKLYIGFHYSMVRQEFRTAAKKERILNKIETVFICIGGTDPHDVTWKATKAALSNKSIKKINVVMGSQYRGKDNLIEFASVHQPLIQCYSDINAETMVELLEQSQIAICPASTIAFEAFCIGLNMVSGYFVDDQKRFATYINDQKLALSAGNLSVVSEEYIAECIKKAFSASHFLKQKQVMQGEQSVYINAIFEELKN